MRVGAMREEKVSAKPAYIPALLFLFALLVGAGGILQHMESLKSASSGPELLTPGPALATFTGTLQSLKSPGKIQVRDIRGTVMTFRLNAETPIFQKNFP